MAKDIELEDESENAQSAKLWWSKLDAAKEAFKPSWDMTKMAWEEYLGPQLKSVGQGVSDTNTLGNQARFPIYNSCTKTMQSMLYSRTPIVVAEKAFEDLDDDIARLACQDLERLARYLIRSCAFDSTMNYMRDNFIHGGKATCKTYFESEINETAEKEYCVQKQVPVPPDPNVPQDPNQPPPPPQMQMIWVDSRGEQQDPANLKQDDQGQVYYEVPAMDEVCVGVCPVHYRDILHNPNARWQEEIVWKAYRETFTREEFREKFGEVEGVPFNVQNENDKTPSDEKKAKIPTATVWNIWDKEHKKLLWLVEGKKDDFIRPLQSNEEAVSGDDPYELDDFWPSVNFLLGTCGPDSLNPVPDYVQLRPFILQLHALAETLQINIRSLKTQGVYDAGIPGLKDAVEGMANCQFAALENFQELVGDKGLEGIFRFFPMQEIAETVSKMIEVIGVIEEWFNETWGIPDIVRGGSAPNEGYQKQQMKGEWMSIRATVPGRAFQRAVRDAIEKMCDLAIKMFPEQKLMDVMGVRYNKPEDQELWPERLLLLKDDDERKVRISIQTDSTILMNETADLEQKNYTAKIVTEGLSSIAAIMQQDPESAPAAIQVLIDVVSGTQQGKGVEGMLRSWQKKKLEQLQNPAPPPPDPKIQVEQMKQEGKMQELQVKSQMDQQKQAGDFQIQQAKAQNEMQIEQIQAQADIQTTMAKIQAEVQQSQIEGAAKMELEKMLATLKAQLEILQAGLKVKSEQHSMKVKEHETALDASLQVWNTKEAVKLSREQAKNAYQDKGPEK